MELNNNDNKKLKAMCTPANTLSSGQNFPSRDNPPTTKLSKAILKRIGRISLDAHNWQGAESRLDE